MIPFSVSIIVITYNGANKIANLFRALEGQSVLDFELIVVVDGSTDNTREVIQSYSGKFKNFHVFFQQNCGRASSRNFGARHASGDVLIFYDDDMVPYSDSVARHIDFHCIRSRAIVSGNAIESFDKQKTDFQNYKAALTKKWTLKYHEGINVLNYDNLFLSSANMSIRRREFNELKGFQEALSDGEDIELALRAKEIDIDVCFDKSNNAVHLDFVTCKGYITRLRQYARANRAIREMHTSYVRGDGKEGNLSKRLVYRLAAMPFMVSLIDNYNILLLLPVQMRYKLYDIITHAFSAVYPDVVLDKKS